MAFARFVRYPGVLALACATLQVAWCAAAADGSSGYVRITPVTRNNTPSAATITLAEAGKARHPIVVSPAASAGTRAVAAELATYLERLSGAPFTVQAGDGRTGIVLGTLAEFPDSSLREPLAIVNGADGKEAYAIRTRGDRLALVGATELGASHAAFRLLDELGVRWLFPMPEWEVVPRVQRLAFGRDITDRPSILSRVIWFEAGSGGEEQNARYAAWRRHNRQAESFTVNAGHNLDAVIRANQAAFDAHPEYYALVGQSDGSKKRQGPQLELADPAVRKMVVEYAVSYFDANPGADMVSLDPADTTTHSVSPESLALGSVSDRVFGIANEAARALQKRHPGRMIGLYSYNAHWDPPSFALEPNVHVLLSGLGQGACTPAERDALWPKRCRNLGFYEYYSVWLWSFDRLPGSWTNDVRGIQRHNRDIVALGCTSVSAESTSSWGPNGRGYYMATRLLWNPDIDVDAALADFYETAFGAGAAAMRRYYDRLDPGSRPFMSKHLLGLAFRDVEEATARTRLRPDVQARLDHVKQYLRYVHLDWLRNREPASEEQKQKLSTAIMTSLFRTRASSLTAWEMIRQNWGGNKYPGQDREPWMVDAPYTRQAIELEFREGVEFFQPRQIGTAVAFSEDLVPVAWKNAPAVASDQSYQGRAVYVLYSFAGEALEFTTWAGTAWGGINRFTVTDAAGAEISRGQLPNDKTTVHRIQVPKKGMYKLDYNDNGSYWSMHVEPGRAATIPMGQSQDYRNSKVMQEMYFYVPKGTRQIEYYYTRTAYHPGGPHKVVDPTGNVVKDVDVNGDWVAVPVGPGMDGRLWSLREAVLGLFWFNNVPNYLAASPDALLVPAELATKDRLPVRR